MITIDLKLRENKGITRYLLHDQITLVSVHVGTFIN
jgi:hypothetical protein